MENFRVIKLWGMENFRVINLWGMENFTIFATYYYGDLLTSKIN